MMQCRHFDLDPLDSISTYKSDLCVSFTLIGWFAKLKSHNPLYLRFQVRVLGVKQHIGDVQTSQGVAGGVCSSVNTLNFLEGNITFCNFFNKGSVVTRSLHSMWNIAGVC